MKNKILHIGESIYGGGAESVLRNTLIILKENETVFQNKLIVNSGKNEDGLIDFFFHSKQLNPLSKIFSFNNYKKLKRCLKEYKPNIIHIHHLGNLTPSIFLAVLKYKKHNKVKVLHSVHTFEYVCSHQAGYDYNKGIKCTDCASELYKYKIFKRKCSRGGKLHFIGKGITSLFFSYFTSRNVVDHWTTPSIFLRDKMLLQPGMNPEGITVLRNPVLSLKKNKSKKVFFNTVQEFKFVYFGRFSEEKNIECIIKSFKIASENIANFKLILIGQGLLEKKLKELVDSESLQDRVEFINFLPKKELEGVLSTCHVSVLASKCYETASMVIIESIQNDLIPIACNHGGMKEMLDICKLGFFFKDNDYKELSNKMIDSFLNYHVHIKKIEKNKDNILEEFTKYNYRNKLVEIYSKI
ncbi:hypothetical protein CW731_07940 [Polaribacter sp. ALD11]|uniref:glycosyltransferase family 1 protein n=1 Tax=Polaribacter sp. ALD11 TaxID=2058137 RepID=UPI000C305E53|nr:glycosyltransferase [Polaribacter sp. ALD11]AUC85232.1 hypothetical protein CW731_07940 [Polaribacter sp. ALD11]